MKFTCKISFLEIYNEQILDLLDPSSVNLQVTYLLIRLQTIASTFIFLMFQHFLCWQIREDVKKGVYVDNLKEVEVSSARDVLQQLVQV